MKTIVTLFLVTIATFAHCQSQNVYYKDSVIEYYGSATGIDTVKTVYIDWTVEGNGMDFTSYRLKKGKWVKYQRNTTHLGKSINSQIFLREVWDVDLHAWTPAIRWLYDTLLYKESVWSPKRQLWMDKRKDTSYQINGFSEKRSVQAEYRSEKDTVIYYSQLFNRMNSLGLVLEERYYLWDTTTQSWQGNNGCEYQYNGKYRIGSTCYLAFDTLPGGVVRAENKTVQKMDTNGYTFETVIYKWDTTAKTWEYESKQENTSLENQTGHESSFAKYAWDKVGKHWVGVERSWQQSNKKTWQLEGINYGWDSTDQKWELASKLRSEYDPSGRYLTRFTEYRYKDKLGQLVLYSDQVHSIRLNAHGDIIADSVYQPGETAPISYHTYSYSTTNKILEEMKHIWVYGPNKWTQGYKTTYTYDSKDSLISKIDSDTKLLYDYDQNGNLVNREHYQWNPATMNWSKSNKTEQVWTNGNVTYLATYFGTTTSNDWIPILKKNTSYDAQNRNTRLIETYWDYSKQLFHTPQDLRVVYGEHGNVIHTENYGWDYTSNKRVFHFGMDAYYSLHDDVTSYKEEKDAVSFTIYPNPSEDYLHTSYSQPFSYQLIDVSGHIVQEDVVASKEQRIDVRQLNIGIYVFKVHLEGKVMTRSFVKK